MNNSRGVQRGRGVAAVAGGKRSRWNVGKKKTTGEGGECRENDIVIHPTLSQVESERCKTSSAQSPMGEILQFKQSKQLFYSDAHFSLAGG